MEAYDTYLKNFYIKDKMHTLAERKKLATTARSEAQTRFSAEGAKLSDIITELTDYDSMEENELMVIFQLLSPHLEELGYTVTAELIPWFCADCGTENLRTSCSSCSLAKSTSLVRSSFETASETLIKHKAADTMVCRIESTMLYHGDYSDELSLHPRLHVHNVSSEPQTITITATINGQHFSWNSATLKADEHHYFYTSSIDMAPGDYDVEWFINGVSSLKDTYRIKPNSHSRAAAITSNITAKVRLAIYDDENSRTISSGHTEGRLSQLSEGTHFMPRISITNRGSDSTHDFTVVLNGAKVYRWTEQILETNVTKNYITLVKDALVGENTCVCYIDGVEIARWSFTITDDTQ